MLFSITFSFQVLNFRAPFEASSDESDTDAEMRPKLVELTAPEELPLQDVNNLLNVQSVASDRSISPSYGSLFVPALTVSAELLKFYCWFNFSCHLQVCSTPFEHLKQPVTRSKGSAPMELEQGPVLVKRTNSKCRPNRLTIFEGDIDIEEMQPLDLTMSKSVKSHSEYGEHSQKVSLPAKASSVYERSRKRYTQEKLAFPVLKNHSSSKSKASIRPGTPDIVSKPPVSTQFEKFALEAGGAGSQDKNMEKSQVPAASKSPPVASHEPEEELPEQVQVEPNVGNINDSPEAAVDDVASKAFVVHPSVNPEIETSEKQCEVAQEPNKNLPNGKKRGAVKSDEIDSCNEKAETVVTPVHETESDDDVLSLASTPINGDLQDNLDNSIIDMHGGDHDEMSEMELEVVQEPKKNLPKGKKRGAVKSKKIDPRIKKAKIIEAPVDETESDDETASLVSTSTNEDLQDNLDRSIIDMSEGDPQEEIHNDPLFKYDPRERYPDLQYNLRVRRYATPYWIHNESAEKVPIMMRSITREDIKDEKNVNRALKKAGITHSQLNIKSLVKVPASVSLEKIKLLKERINQKRKMKPRKQQSSVQGG